MKKYIIGVDIFMSVETSPLRYDKDFLIDEFIRDTEGSSIYYTSRTRGEQLYSRIFKNEKQLIDDIKTKSGAMYKVLSFDFLDFNGSNITKTLEKDLTDITANEQLIYEDQLYSEEIPSGILLYNSKLHEYGMKSTVKTDFNINDLLHKTKFSYQDTLSATDIKDRLMPPLLASFNTSYMAKDYDRALFYILFSDGNRAIHIDESNSNSIRTISGGYLPKITPLLFLNPLITKVKVYILVDDHSIKFTPEYSNEDGISFAKIKPLDIDSRSDINILAYSEEVVKKNRPNILKVSEENNPFIISNSKTYKVGGGEIFKLHVNTKAVSSGQFGEYPLIALCSDGRWALGLGSGEVDYSSIKPLSRDVYKKGENNDPMAQLDDAVVFATERGLLISSGEEVQELSQLIEGDLFRFTEPGFDHMDLARQAITNSLLVQLLPAVSKIPFKEYLNGSNIGYIYGENREIVIANPNYDYCYIYSLSSGIWYKNNIRIKYFLSDYPCLYAVSDNKLIDLTAEQPTAGRDTFFLTKPVKLDGLSFKEAHRAVLRSYIKPSGTTYCGFYVFGSEDGQLWRFLGGTEFDGKIALTGETADFRDIGCNVERIDVKYIRIAFAGKIKSGSKLDFMELLARSLSWK
ncbi:MAG: hypothetical protein LBK58_06005 [Prevotellaceae bacterium]|nr:hypothetical protein [Prevotellaceae bacterium]